MITASKNKPSHLKALLRKNWILLKRSPWVSILEILVPIAFAALTIMWRQAVPPETTPQTTYYNNPDWFFTYSGLLDASALSLMKDCNANENGGKVALAPAGDALVAQLDSVFGLAGFTTQVFNNNDEINEYTSRDDYGNTPGMGLCFAVVINKNSVDNQYEYMLRFNVSNSEDIPDTSDPRIKDLSRANLETFGKYARRGFLVVQNLIDNLILQSATINTASIETHITSRTVEPSSVDDFIDAVSQGGQISFYLDLPLRLPFLRLLNALVREKEQRIREGMKIMGLQNISFYLSWFITYFIIFTIISVIVSIEMTISAGLFGLSSYGYVFLWHWEYTICLMTMAFFISVFFNNAKRANIIGLVVSVALTFIQAATSDTTPSGTLFGLSLLPPTSMGLSSVHIMSLEAAQLGLTSDTVNKTIQNYKITYHYGAMVLCIVIFVLLGAYLDQVLPSEFGIKKHPLFFLKSLSKKFSKNPENNLRKRKARINHLSEDEIYIEHHNENFEEVGPNLRAQDENNQSVKVQNLRKVFDGNKVAVNGVNFNMYKGQIFALLGHNGAGKTTTISMITGLISPTEGTTNVFGLDVNTELDEVRKSMGICPQHDVLFGDLTVKEHLELFAVFKGMNSKDIPQEVEKIIRDIGLEDKRNYLSKKLSGGQKRKLSVGIAFIGGSKFILLDEPSSGMDTYARRKMWQLLENYKNDRVILLTTHFMDEADYLGDRIGIMSGGQLRCLGSSLFLKTRFGVGYSLTLVKKDINTTSEPIKALIHEHIPKSKVLSDVSAELIVQLPLESTSKFRDLFEDLDKNLIELKVSSYGISVTTLEEVFLNVAKMTSGINQLENSTKIKSMKTEEFNPKTQRIAGVWALFKTHFPALVMKRVHYLKRDLRGLLLELLLPFLIVILGIVIGKSTINNSVDAISLIDNLYGYKFPALYNQIIPPPINAPVDTAFIQSFDSSYFEMTPSTATDLAQFDQDVFNAQDKDILSSSVNIFSVFMEASNSVTQTYEYAAFIDSRAREAAPFALNKINNAILKYATGNSQIQINVIVAPFEQTHTERAIGNIASGFLYTFAFAIGMSFIAGSLVTFIVKEREVNAKHQQIVSGASLSAYWFSNYFVDYLKYLVPAMLNALMAIAFNAKSLTDGDKMGAFWTIFILYGFALIPFTYLTGFLFKNYGNAQVASFFFNFAVGFLGGTVVGVLRLFDSTSSAAEILQWILRPIPTFSMTYGLMNLTYRELYVVQGTLDSLLNPFDINLAGGDILCLGLEAVVYMALIFLVEHLKNTRSLATIITRENRVAYVPKKLDEDVENEMREVEQSNNKTYAIKVDKLRKVYALKKGEYKVAVDRLSFGVRNGDCFALLGTNGAGKTTTFKILSGDYVQTSGNAFINGYPIPEQLPEARHDIGYCPQFDSLLENLTAKEHLELYAAIKGIPHHLRDKLVQEQLIQMNLKQYENILAGTYSGGNKRKLSVAIAMIGNPSVVFLDEPSTGMDPEARRFMWNVISRISKERKQSSVILTTHSMEEAEALATKMGIMVNGNLKCLGTCQHIKNKFGGGYEIEVKLNLPTKEEVDKVIKEIKYKGKEKEFVEKGKVDEILEKLQSGDLKTEISEQGSGSVVFNELKKGRIPINMLVEWVLVEQSGKRLRDFLTRNFDELVLLEHFQAFYRFKVSNKVTVGKFFGCLEDHKAELNILQYSICQSSIEQIFNAFASEGDPQNTEDHVAIHMK